MTIQTRTTGTADKKVGVSVRLEDYLTPKNHWKFDDQCPSSSSRFSVVGCFECGRRILFPLKKKLASNWSAGVIKCLCFCLLLTWLTWLHLSNYQLSRDFLQLKREFHSFRSRENLFADDHQIRIGEGEGDEYDDIQNIMQIDSAHAQPNKSDDPYKEHFIYKHTKKKRRKRKKRNETIKQVIQDSMKKNSYALFLPGLNESTTQRGYFKWNLSFVGSSVDEVVASNLNGTFTFKRNGFFLISSQVNVKGINNQQNYGVSYGYKTVLVKENHEDEDLMTTEITQDNRGVCYRNSDHLKRCATDSISHLVIRYFRKGDRIAIKANRNNYDVNYHLTPKNSYIAIIGLDLWNHLP